MKLILSLFINTLSHHQNTNIIVYLPVKPNNMSGRALPWWSLSLLAIWHVAAGASGRGRSGGRFEAFRHVPVPAASQIPPEQTTDHLHERIARRFLLRPVSMLLWCYLYWKLGLVRLESNRSARFLDSWRSRFLENRNRSALFRTRNRGALVSVLFGAILVITDGTELPRCTKK